MAAFALTNAAKKDLFGIARFTEKRWGRKQRNSYLSRFDEMFHQLAENPQVGTTCDGIKPGYRKFPLASHVIYYHLLDEQVEIVRILHKSMDVSETVFSQEPL